jgi:hypothetical protein
MIYVWLPDDTVFVNAKSYQTRSSVGYKILCDQCPFTLRSEDRVPVVSDTVDSRDLSGHRMSRDSFACLAEQYR